MSTVIRRSRRAEAAPKRGTAALVRNSMAGSLWTTVSRLSGLAQTVAVGAVLGATFLGNSYQSINALPNIMYYQLLAGSLFASLLVPPLVRHVDTGDEERARRLVGGFFGVLLMAALALSILLVVAGPLLVRLLSLGVQDPDVAAAQVRVGLILLMLFVPQVFFYLVAGTSGSVLNAHGRFALAAGAPTLENIGMIATLIVAAIIFGTGVEVGTVSNAELLLLGLGTTAAVGLHAAVVWLGARSTGTTLTPRAGWRDPEVRSILHRVVPTLAYTGLEAAQVFAIFMVADRLRGGVVDFQLALSFFFLPAAVVTWPIARALLPQLSRYFHAGLEQPFKDELTRAVRLTTFITVPTAFAYLALSVPMARAITFGQLGNPEDVRRIAMSLASLAPGVVGESWFILGTYAFYARLDVRSPLRSMVLRVGLSVGLMALAWSIRGPSILPLLGLSLSAGSFVGAAHAWRRLRTTLPSTAATVSSTPFARVLLASILMLIPAAATAWAVGRLPSTQLTEVAAMVCAAIVGASVYFWLHHRWRAPELDWLRSGLAGSKQPSADGATG